MGVFISWSGKNSIGYIYVLESQEFMINMYALKTDLQKVDKTSNAEDAQVFVRSCMTVLRRQLLYLEGER